MSALSPAQLERARKNERVVLRTLAETKQTAVAQALGISESAMSRMKDGDIAATANLLAVLGLKIVPETYRCVNPDRMGAVVKLAEAAIEKDGLGALLWGDEL